MISASEKWRRSSSTISSLTIAAFTQKAST